MSRKKELPADQTPATVTTPAAEQTPATAPATEPAPAAKPQQNAEFLKELNDFTPPPAETPAPPPAPAPFALNFEAVSALEFNFLSAKADILGVQHLLRFAGFLGTQKQKYDVGKNLVFETRQFEEDQEPKYLFEVCALTPTGVVRTASHFAINQYWSLAQFFTQEISDNADTIANNLYAVTLIELRAGAAKGGQDLPIFRIERAAGFKFNL
jgi:hypothetical protein